MANRTNVVERTMDYLAINAGWFYPLASVGIAVAASILDYTALLYEGSYLYLFFYVAAILGNAALAYAFISGGRDIVGTHPTFGVVVLAYLFISVFILLVTGLEGALENLFDLDVLPTFVYVTARSAAFFMFFMVGWGWLFGRTPSRKWLSREVNPGPLGFLFRNSPKEFDQEGEKQGGEE